MTTKLLHEEIQYAAEALRGALRSLIEEAGCNPLKPQAVHRHIGVDRVLCWKVSRLIRAERVEEALLQLPGEEALSIFITAFERTTASAGQLDKARTAAAGLNQAIVDHVGDRRTLHLMLDSVPGGQDALGQSRKLLFRGASGLWGIQARERKQILMLAPNADNPDVMDSVVATGWVDIKRMRPDARWRMMKYGPTANSDAPLAEALSRMEADATEIGPSLLLPEFCESVPPLSSYKEDDGTTYIELGASPVGLVGAFDLFMGIRHRDHGPRHAAYPGERAEFGVNVLAPAEHMTYDVFVHRDLANLLENADMAFYSAAFNPGVKFTPFNRMPIEPEPIELDAQSAFESSHYDRHRELLEFMLARTGWRLDDFVGVRYEIEFPPFPSVALFSAPFESR